jgi:hypothetical protein
MANPQLFYRHLKLDARAQDEDAREMELTFSSEQPVERWFGKEILLHNKKAVDLSRLQSVGSLIYGHAPDDIRNILGPVRKAWIAKDRIGRAVVAFDDDESGSLALAKVKSGSLRGVSFGYMIDQAQQINEKETWTDPESGQRFEGPAMVATRWTPYEITLTPIPADATVGIGRDATRSLDGITISTATRKEISAMDKQEIQAMIAEALAGVPKTEDIVANVTRAIAEQNKPKYGCPIDEFQELYGRAAAVSKEAQVEMAAMLAQGRTAAEMQRKLLELATVKPDAQDTGSLEDGDGTGMTPPAPGRQAEIRSFKQISDDDFFAGISNPSAFSIN